MGWATYFAFIFAAINTLTVTYFLAIDNYPSLKSVFPSFELYIIILSSIGIPILIFIGYAHYKKTQGFKSEIDIIIESNPYQRRILVNTETALSLQLKLISIIQEVAKNQDLDQNKIDELEKSEVEELIYTDYKDEYPLYLGISLLLFSIAFVTDRFVLRSVVEA